MKKLKEFLFLSDKGYKDLKKAIVACTITNLALMLPFCVTVMLFNELLNPYVGKQIAWNHIWLLYRHRTSTLEELRKMMEEE